jgi:ABC-2 type transport system ATP-binding protein
MRTVLEARGLVKDYSRARAVDGVDLVVHEGERVGLLGPNGAGKTTTLLMVLGVVTPDEGSVVVCGRPLERQRSRAAEEVGFAAGYLPLAERLRVREYLRLYGNLYGLADPEPAIAAGLARFRVEHLADAMGTELSSGQRTLVGIVRATLHRPRLLVLDEPTIGLDPIARSSVWERIEKLREETGMTVLLTTHYMDEADALCDRVALMHRARLRALGTPDSLKADLGPDATLEDVFRHHTGDTLEAGGDMRHLRQTRRTASRLG